MANGNKYWSDGQPLPFVSGNQNLGGNSYWHDGEPAGTVFVSGASPAQQVDAETALGTLSASGTTSTSIAVSSESAAILSEVNDGSATNGLQAETATFSFLAPEATTNTSTIVDADASTALCYVSGSVECSSSIASEDLSFTLSTGGEGSAIALVDGQGAQGSIGAFGSVSCQTGIDTTSAEGAVLSGGTAVSQKSIPGDGAVLLLISNDSTTSNWTSVAVLFSQVELLGSAQGQALATTALEATEVSAGYSNDGDSLTEAHVNTLSQTTLRSFCDGVAESVVSSIADSVTATITSNGEGSAHTNISGNALESQLTCNGEYTSNVAVQASGWASVGSACVATVSSAVSVQSDSSPSRYAAQGGHLASISLAAPGVTTTCASGGGYTSEVNVAPEGEAQLRSSCSGNALTAVSIDTESANATATAEGSATPVTEIPASGTNGWFLLDIANTTTEASAPSDGALLSQPSYLASTVTEVEVFCVVASPSITASGIRHAFTPIECGSAICGVNGYDSETTTEVEAQSSYGPAVFNADGTPTTEVFVGKIESASPFMAIDASAIVWRLPASPVSVVVGKSKTSAAIRASKNSTMMENRGVTDVLMADSLNAAAIEKSITTADRS